MDPEPLTPAVRVIGRYALYDAIASGGMATVHVGRLLGPVGFSRTVAIKRLHAQFARDPEFVSMFLDEARLAARIRHPNVIPTLDVVATEGELFLVMDYVPGESLARLVRAASLAQQLVPARIVVAIMAGALRGLHAAHEAQNERGEPLGIVHRDVSPQNILVGTDGQARVLDFGVAKAAGRLQTTRDGKLKGKLAYMAPEQLRGKQLDRRTDVFAASVVLWEALTGQRLFRGDNEGAIVTKILEGDVMRPSETIPDGEGTAQTRAILSVFDEVTLKGLSSDPAQRYGTAREMAVALERAAPPAGVSEVSEWVEHFAKDVLLTRARQVADIESNSEIGRTQAADMRASIPELAKEAGRASAPRLSEEGSSSQSRPGLGALRGDLSSISVSHSRPAGVPSSKRMAAIVATVGGVGAVVVFALLFTMRGGPPMAAGSPGSPPLVTSVASAPESPLPAAMPAPTGVAEPPSAPRAPAPSAIAPPVVSHATAPQPVHLAHAVPAFPPPRAAPQAPAPNCNPPFTYDAQGLKHFKPECL